MFILQLGVCNLTGFSHLSSRWDFSLMQRADQAKHFGKRQLTCGVWVGLCPERNHWGHQADFWRSASLGFTHGIWFAWPQPRVPSLQLAVCTADVNSEGLALWDWTFDQLLYLLSLRKYLEKYSSLSSHNLTLNVSSFFFLFFQLSQWVHFKASAPSKQKTSHIKIKNALFFSFLPPSFCSLKEYLICMCRFFLMLCLATFFSVSLHFFFHEYSQFHFLPLFSPCLYLSPHPFYHTLS